MFWAKPWSLAAVPGGCFGAGEGGRAHGGQKPRAIEPSGTVPFLGSDTVFSLPLSCPDSENSHPLLAQITLCYPAQRPPYKWNEAERAPISAHKKIFHDPVQHWPRDFPDTKWEISSFAFAYASLSPCLLSGLVLWLLMNSCVCFWSSIIPQI